MTETHLDAELLRPSGAILAVQIALGDVIQRRAVEGMGLDSTIIDLLVRLDLAPERTLRAVDLCDQLLLSPSHISRMVDRAEANSLATRSPDPNDRRASLITITEAGAEVVSRFGPRLGAVLQSVIHDNLDEDEVDTLVELLGRIETAARNEP
ncbi:MAG: MarR family winged helix-turn-helix transcriptional regulator [Acidimicrobiales bacterium]